MDHPSRPFIALAVAALFGAGTAAGQTPGNPGPPAPHSLWFDAAALADDEILAGVEALTLGRVSLGASIGYSHTAHPRDVLVPPYGYLATQSGPYPVCDPRMLMLCAPPTYYAGDSPRYRAWTAAFTARFYPASFSFRNGASRMQVYAGGHAAYRWSSWDESVVYNGCPYCAYPLAGSAVGGSPRPTPADSVIVMPPNPYPYPVPCCLSPVRHSRGSFEPGLDVGVRLLPIGPLFVEVGGRFTLVTADDAMRRTMQGDVESRLVLAAGLAW